MSIQVHPDDEHAQKIGYKRGKNEAWFFIESDPGASIVYGQKTKNKEELQEMIKQDKWDDIYKKYSYHNELQVSINLKGESGLRMIQKIMDVVRNAAGRFTANVPAVYTDIQTSEITKYNADGSIASKEKSTLPSSNVLTFDYGDRWFCLRPSGTEPKIKIYYTTLGKNLAEAEAEKEKLAEALKPILA